MSFRTAILVLAIGLSLAGTEAHPFLGMMKKEYFKSMMEGFQDFFPLEYYPSSGKDDACDSPPAEMDEDLPSIIDMGCEGAEPDEVKCMCVKHELMDKYENWCGTCKLKFKLDKKRFRTLRMLLGRRGMKFLKKMKHFHYGVESDSSSEEDDGNWGGLGGNGHALQVISSMMQRLVGPVVDQLYPVIDEGADAEAEAEAEENLE